MTDEKRRNPHDGQGIFVNFLIGHSYLPVMIKIHIIIKNESGKNFEAIDFILCMFIFMDLPALFLHIILYML